jgi:hypothetical protein
MCRGQQHSTGCLALLHGTLKEHTQLRAFQVGLLACLDQLLYLNTCPVLGLRGRVDVCLPKLQLARVQRLLLSLDMCASCLDRLHLLIDAVKHVDSMLILGRHVAQVSSRLLR